MKRRAGFSLVEVMIAVLLGAMVIATVVALRTGGHRALVLSEEVERLQRTVHAVGRHAADGDFAALARVDDDWIRSAGADPREVRVRVEATGDADVVRFIAEARGGRVACRRLVVRASASLARAFPLGER